MMPATGLYGHTSNNDLKSLLLFGGFLATLIMLWAMLMAAWASGAAVLYILDRATFAWVPQMLERAASAPHLPLLETLHYPLAAGMIWTITAVCFGERLVRVVTGARQITRAEAPQLYRSTEALAISAGMPTPRLAIVETQATNAFATGLWPSDATITVTRGLLERLDRRGLEAVLAHELTHIRNRDSRTALVAMVLQGAIARLADIVWSRLTRHPISLADIFRIRPVDTDPDGMAAAREQKRHFLGFLYWHGLILGPPAAGVFGAAAGRVAFWLGMASLAALAIRSAKLEASGQPGGIGERLGYLPSIRWLLLTPIWISMLYAGLVAAIAYVLSAWLAGAILRARELVADAGAVELTKDADGLVMALAAVHGNGWIDDHNESLQMVMIAGPSRGWLATHPPLEHRVAALRLYAGARIRLTPAVSPAMGRQRQGGAAHSGILPAPLGFGRRRS